MIFQKNMIRKLWYDARTGTTHYYLLLLSMLNFILITYNFLIEGTIIFDNLISNMWIYGIIFLVLYFPISVMIGRWHTNSQISVDLTVKMHKDPIMAKMVRTLLDVQTGVATEEEIIEFRKQMAEIEKQNID